MPNWCITQITITHESSEKIKELGSLIEKWTSNGSGESWLGNIVLGSGVGTVDTGNDTDLKCRGSISYVDIFENQLIITTETAWCPFLQMWQKVLDKYLPDAELIYNAEECGCGIYSTNDPCLIGKYNIDSCDIEEIEIENFYDADEEYVREICQKLLKTKEKNVEKLIKMVESSEYYLSINKWKNDDVSVWD